MSETDFFIKITGKEKGDLYITDLEGKYKAQINGSLIVDSNYEVVDGVAKVSEDCFNDWFAEDIMAEALKLFELFCLNIPLFWKNKELIFKEPRYYSIRMPEALVVGMSLNGGHQPTLGELFNIWDNEEVFSAKCRECGGKSGVYLCLGSHLSGTVFTKRVICLQCGKEDIAPKTDSFGKFLAPLKKYSPIEPIAETPASLQELVAVCKGEASTSDD